MRKIPSNAFEVYVGMGPERSYRAVAAKFGCTKQAVTKKAGKEKWQERLDDMEAEARRMSDKRVIKTMRDLSDKQLKLWQLVESRALQALRDHSLGSAMDAAKALDLATKNMRLILGEATERTENVEQVIRREFDRFLTTEPEDDWSEAQPSPPIEAALTAATLPQEAPQEAPQDVHQDVHQQVPLSAELVEAPLSQDVSTEAGGDDVAAQAG